MSIKWVFLLAVLTVENRAKKANSKRIEQRHLGADEGSISFESRRTFATTSSATKTSVTEIFISKTA